MTNTKIAIIFLLIIFGGVGFFAGMKYQQSKQPTFNRQFGGQQRTGMMGQGQFSGNRQDFRMVNGEIIGSDDKSITVKMQDGSSKIVILSDKTTINKAASATKEDLKTGEKVAIFGENNSDGSVSANNIQLNPVMGGQLRNPNN